MSTSQELSPEQIRILQQSEKEGWRYAAELELERQRLLKEVYKLRHRLSEYNWTLNPDRSGGQFTQDEIKHSWGC